MTKGQLKNRLKNLFQQLELTNLYKDYYIKELGSYGLSLYIDEVLDEINFILEELKKFDN